MGTRTKTALLISVFTLALVTPNCLLPFADLEATKVVQAQFPERVAPPREPKYAGFTKCAACHYKQYENWMATPHAKAFDYLPTKYRNNAECLQCHSSRSEFASAAQTLPPNLPGVSCEDCHGPGREHTNMALSFLDQDKTLTDDAVELLRSKIQRLALGQCVQCHVTQGHKAHPKFDPEPAKRGQGKLTAPRRRSFFDVHQ